MRATLFILLSILFFEVVFATSYLHQKEEALPSPELQITLFGLTPPQPAKLIKEALSYQTVLFFYPSQEITLKVEGEMLLAHINKIYTLLSWYVPSNLVSLEGGVKTVGPETIQKIVIPHLKDLFMAVEKSCGCKIAVLSAYRSYQTQIAVYNWWVAQVGRYYADLGSARSGHSEHQLGTTVDLTSSTVGYELTRNFGFTCEGRWLEKNAHKYGFVLSYPKGKDGTTGYVWEPWHFRFVGKEVASEVYHKGITLEEYFSSR